MSLFINRGNLYRVREQISEWFLRLIDRIGGPADWTNYPGINMRWMGEWVQQLYYRGDVVVDGLWLCIANKDTEDRAGPVPSGTSFWILPDVPVWSTTPQYTGTVYSGLRLVPPAGRMLAVTSVRVWVQDANDANASYRVVLYNNSTGKLEVGNVFAGDVVATPQWVTVGVTPKLLLEGVDVSVLLQQWNNATTTDYNFQYTRVASTQTAVDPGAGNWNTNNQTDSLRISYIDDAAIDNSTELGSVIPGTSIRVAEHVNPANVYSDYNVVSVTDNGTWFEYGVVYLGDGPQGSPPVGELCQIQISIPVAVPTTYVTLTDAVVSNPYVSGYIAFDNITGGSNTQDGYGIDVHVQEYIESDDWDIMALSSTELPGLAGAATEFGPGVNIIDSQTTDFWDRWLPVEKENLAKWSNNEVVPPGPPPTWDDTFRVQQFVSYASDRFVRVWDPYIIREVNWLETAGLIAPGRAAIILSP